MLKQLARIVQKSDPKERPARPNDHNPETDGLLLTPEERVIVLLEEHNGRVRQQDIVAETGYADGTVSQVLNEMEENGRITRYWKGNGKVVALPELGSNGATP